MVISLTSFHGTGVNIKNHYDTLGVTPAANQAQIKKAYYKLSMKYHPDQNRKPKMGSALRDETSMKFVELSEAYEVLIDPEKRALYNRSMDFSNDDDDDQYHRQRFQRKRPHVYSGRTHIYNFDAWNRAHYQQTFDRAQKWQKTKAAYEHTLRHQSDNSPVNLTERLLVAVSFIMFLMYCLFDGSRNRKRRNTDPTKYP